MKYELVKKINEILTDSSLSPSQIEERCSIYFDELLKQLLDGTTQGEKRVVRSASEHEAVVLKTYIDTHIDVPLDIDALAQTIYKCPSQTIRIFKKHYNVTPYTYHSAARIKEASRLLESTDMPIKDIAFTLGFNDEHYFSATFKKQLGFTPTEFRRKSFD